MRAEEEIRAEIERCKAEREKYAAALNFNMESVMNARYWALKWVLEEERP